MRHNLSRHLLSPPIFREPLFPPILRGYSSLSPPLDPPLSTILITSYGSYITLQRAKPKEEAVTYYSWPLKGPSTQWKTCPSNQSFDIVHRRKFHNADCRTNIRKHVLTCLQMYDHAAIFCAMLNICMKPKG